MPATPRACQASLCRDSQTADVVAFDAESQSQCFLGGKGLPLDVEILFGIDLLRQVGARLWVWLRQPDFRLAVGLLPGPSAFAVP